MECEIKGILVNEGNMVNIKREIFYIAEPVELVLLLRKQQHTLDFICQKTQLTRLFTMRQKGLVFEQQRGYWG